MATQLKKTVKPSGGDYTSLDACMFDNEQNLVTADKYFDVEIDGTWENVDTPATVHNYTTDATRYINIYTTSACRHPGYYSSNSPYYRIETSDAVGILDVSCSYVTITGIQFKNTSIYAGGMGVNGSYTGCLFDKIVGISKRTTLFLTAYSSMTNSIRNSVAISNSYNSTSYALNATGNGSKQLYNIVAVTTASTSHAVNYSSGTGTNVFKNIYASSYGGSAFAGTPPMTTCASSDATGSEGLQNIAYSTSSGAYFTNVTSGSEDFHITTTDSALDGVGTDLSATFTDDIDGDTRSAWDIGVDYITGGAAPTSSTGFMTTMRGFWGA